MWSGILIAIIGFLAGIMGGLLNAYFQKNAQDREFSRKAKREFYDGLLDHLWEANLASDSADRSRHAADFLKRTTKIAIYGSDEVVERVADVVGVTNLYDPNDQMKIARLVSAMRSDLGQPTNMETDRTMLKIIFERPNRGSPPIVDQ